MEIKFETKRAQAIFDELYKNMEVELSTFINSIGTRAGLIDRMAVKMARRWDMLNTAIVTAHTIDIQERALRAQVAVAGIIAGTPQGP